MLEITYKDGRGHMQINLDSVLQIGASGFRKILDTIDLSDQADAHITTIYDYIDSQIKSLQKERAEQDANSAVGKDKISKINATIKNYLTFADILTKKYGLTEILDDDARTILKSATVYAVISNDGKSAIAEHAGWTFKKAGYVFDVYSQKIGRSTFYKILLRGTGLMVTEARKKSEIVSEITPKILDFLKKTDKISPAKKRFDELMIEAGYTASEERRESISDVGKKEVKTMTNYTFAPDAISYDGNTFPAEYNVIKNGKVLVFAITGCKPDGRKIKQRIDITPDHVDYSAALAAAKGEVFERTGERVENIPDSEDNTPAEMPVDNPKKARGPVPEKTFIGDTIHGNGWRIYFDGEKARTRIIFDGNPSAAAKAAVENAGFYFSSVMNSWNKKLTFKAYRAAKAVSIELMSLYAA